MYRAVDILEPGDTVVLHSVRDIGTLHGDVERFIDWVARRLVNVRIGNYLLDLTDHSGVLMLRTLVTVYQFEQVARQRTA
ncbi:hypothetical protein [Microbacterium sp. WCS2018Hpa-9]|uniref:hypothetical protein n=1 Tax=Microbacterium sp. WCS2018Hpa-9 TaxID=3073635 RepID=UPI00288BD3A7|nr:hypothetical protein [Microbacterium sp. WCS2018Hpa-9]